jgi:hypothetical protein
MSAKPGVKNLGAEKTWGQSQVPGQTSFAKHLNALELTLQDFARDFLHALG